MQGEVCVLDAVPCDFTNVPGSTGQLDLRGAAGIYAGQKIAGKRFFVLI